MGAYFRSVLGVGLAVWLAEARAAGVDVPAWASGTVYLDRNANGARDPGEAGLAGIRVSNQRDFAVTDRQGRWRLPVLEGVETTFFVIKPRGYTPPLTVDQLPKFSYTHKPAGSRSLKFPGLPPTGSLPPAIDFPLYPQSEPDKFQAIFFGDTQPRDLLEVNYFKRDILDGLMGPKVERFGVTLGDIVFDDLSVMEPHNQAVALLGLPWWNVIGNHDVNTDATSSSDYDDTYNRIYGPSYFSFDYGPVHFVALNNINWAPPETRSSTNAATWRAGLDAQQMVWLAEDLKRIPPRQLVLLMMHVPLNDLTNREAIYRLIENRPYCLSIAGHTHWHEHRYISREGGWRGPEPHHHIVNVTACGSWWTGQPDEWGIPHATMSDGAPNGYTVLTFTDKTVRVDYQVARRPASYQLSVMTPETVGVKESLPVYVNVFNGSVRSRVRLRVDGQGPWQELEKVLEPDPALVATRNREPAEPLAPFRRLPLPIKSPHLWKITLPTLGAPGEHQLEVLATDDNGREHPTTRLVRVK